MHACATNAGTQSRGGHLKRARAHTLDTALQVHVHVCLSCLKHYKHESQQPLRACFNWEPAQFLKSHWSAGVLLTHIAMAHELQRGTKRTGAVHELPLAQQVRAATAAEMPSFGRTSAAVSGVCVVLISSNTFGRGSATIVV